MGSLGEIDFDSDNEVQSLSDALPEASKLPLLCLNHVSYVCKSVRKSVRFYEEVLGFVLIKRPSSFNFEGAWLFNYGVGIHLLGSNNVPPSKGKKINPKDNHISFQCSDIMHLVQKLEDMNIEYVTAQVQDSGIKVDQVFFHDPDGNMIEICNCENLPVIPLTSCPLKLPGTYTNTNKPKPNPKSKSFPGRHGSEIKCSGEAANVSMMENLLSLEMMNILI